MKKILDKKILKIASFVVSIVTLVALGYLTYEYIAIKKTVDDIIERETYLQDNFDERLFDEHLKIMENFELSATVTDLQKQVEEFEEEAENNPYSTIGEIYKSYGVYLSKLSQNKNAGLDISGSEEAAEKWADMLLNQDYDALLAEINTQIESLDNDYSEYLASLPPPEPVNTGSGYSYQTVSTEKGTFGAYLIKIPISSVEIVTAAANGNDCKDNCPVKPLAEHVNDNGGFAGMNGSYFCPPDYSSCGGKINSFDFALYKSSSDKWLNDGALGWSDTGLITFRNGSARFYKKSTEYDGDGVDAGISNYPSLLDDRDIVVNNDKLSSYQKDVKGTRGAIGIGNENLYLAIITGATVEDAAYAMRALGAKDALNLDGGGSAAMYYNGSYIVGPGRNLPNAVVLVNK